MTDICKCKGEDGKIICPYKDQCYRFTAKADELYQSYFIELPIINGKCDYYWGEDGEKIWNKTEKL